MARKIAAPICAFLCAAICSTSFAQQSSGQAAFKNPKLSVEKRVDDLVSHMTLEEKVSQIGHTADAVPRLGIPEYNWWNEGLHGVARAGNATVFPQAIGLAATFDEPLIHQVADVISTEFRAKYYAALHPDGSADWYRGLTVWSPNINIFRDPRWGRGQETYGEDPFLTGRMGVAFVTGLQGDDPNYFRVISTPKHFAVHSGPEPSRHSIDVPASKHDMEDTYLPAFRAAVVEGKAESVMCAYNRVNGEPACANTFLLQDQLRGAWKFKGYVVSDCDAVVDIFSGHHFTRSLTETGAVSLKTGMDNECADFFTKAKDNSDYVKFIDAVHQGLLTEKDLDVSLRRLFTARMKLGMFDPPEKVPYANIAESEIDSAAHRKLALQAARESIVLLKNDGTLPLSAATKRIAVVGALAESVRVLHGNYSGTASRATSALDGIRQQFPSAQVKYAPGMNFLRAEEVIPAAVLSTEDGQAGLRGEYFSNRDFGDSPQLVRVDKAVDLQRFHPERSSIAPPPGMVDYSVRWTGFLTPSESGEYQIGNVGSMNRLWLDGKLIVDDFILHDPKPTKATVQLEKGHRYPIKLEYGQGGTGIRLVWLHVIANPIPDAVALANNADAVIAVVGITSQLEGEEMKVDVPGFKGGDRISLDLPKEEEDLLEAMKATGKTLIVVLMNGSALSVNWANDHANAILDAWYSGEEGGTAIGETLAGVNNPAGRLPVTFYKGVDQLPPFEDYAMTNRTYRYFEGQPLYPFGYGLSYSKFEYSNLKLSTADLTAGDSLTVDTDVKNTSQLSGDEVVELYLTFPKLLGSPLRALRGFTRLHMAAGATQHLQFTLGPRDLSMVDLAGDRRVAAGTYSLSVGGGQPGTVAARAETEFRINGDKRLPE